MATAALERFLRRQAGPAGPWPGRELLAETVLDLRCALDLCADPKDGWPEVFCADVYEQSRRVVPDREDGDALHR